MPEDNRQQQKKKILEFFESEDGISKLRKAGVPIEDDFGVVLPTDKILRNIAYNRINLTTFEEAFGPEWIEENWQSLLEILHAHVIPDCLTVTIQDTEGNKILSAYVNAFQLFGTIGYKHAISATIANSVFRTLVALPTHRELAKELEDNDEDSISQVKDQLDYFKEDPRNSVILNLVGKNSPKLRKLIKEKTGH